MTDRYDIPEEYLTSDFGWGAQSDAEYEAQVKEAEEQAQETINQVHAHSEETVQTLKEDIQELERVIMPLLVNLLKTSDKEWIRWPDRKEQVEEHIEKVLSITRSE
jgi:hypothetical protein